MTNQDLKNELLDFCKTSVDQRLSRIQKTIQGIEESLFGESKSSAGDKHETARAMLQIDRENAGKQLHEIEQLQQILKRIKITGSSAQVRLGSLVKTTKGIYFMSISAGQHTINESTYYCIAWKSPIGQLLAGKNEGDACTFNGNKIVIKGIV